MSKTNEELETVVSSFKNDELSAYNLYIQEFFQKVQKNINSFQKEKIINIYNNNISISDILVNLNFYNNKNKGNKNLINLINDTNNVNSEINCLKITKKLNDNNKKAESEKKQEEKKRRR